MNITFDGVEKLIILTDDSDRVSVRDIWSHYVRWVATSDNGKYFPAFRLTGGEPIDPQAGIFIPYYLYCINDWRIRPYEKNYSLHVEGGSLLVDGGGEAFVPTLGGYTVQIVYSQPVQAFAIGTQAGASAQDIAQAVWDKILSDGNTAMNDLVQTRLNTQNIFAIAVSD